MNWTPHTVKGKFTLLFAGMAFVITVVYTIAVVLILFSAEKLLMSSYMDSTLDGIIHYDLNQDIAPRLDQFSRLYVEGDAVRPIPERLSHLEDGYTELVGDEDLHVFQTHVNGKKYVLTRYQGDFESWEEKIWIYGTILFILLLLTAIAFGSLLATKAVTPITKLARETKELEAELKAGKLYPTSAFSGPWPQDEIGMLGHGLQSLSLRLHTILQNEKNFSSDVSHELRTQLMVLSSSLELLQEGKLTNTELRAVHRALSTVHKMQDTVSVFLNLFRHNAEMQCAMTSIGQILERNEEQWRKAAEEKSNAFSMEISAQPRGEFNKVLCETLISNIVQNALRYTEQGRVQVILAESELQILDSGIGIPEADLPHIFESGYRSASANHIGSGIGLSLAHKCASALKFGITVESKEGHGSRFVVHFKPERPVSS